MQCFPENMLSVLFRTVPRAHTREYCSYVSSLPHLDSQVSFPFVTDILQHVRYLSRDGWLSHLRYGTQIRGESWTCQPFGPEKFQVPTMDQGKRRNRSRICFADGIFNDRERVRLYVDPLEKQWLW